MTTIVESAKTHCMELLEKHCKNYPYHNPAHTEGVYHRASYLAMAEGVEGDDLTDLQLATLFHDTGFIEQYAKNEYIGARIARKWLETAGHPTDRIEKIEHIIMATVLFSKPKNLLEKIIQDSDLDNIGTKEEFYYSLDYLEELRTIGKVEIPDCSYWQYVYTLLTKFRFHTKTARREREEQQKKDIEHLEKFLAMLGCETPQLEHHRMSDIQ